MHANTNPPTLFVVANASTDADGNFSMSLPPGDYQVQANAEGYLFASDTPAEVTVARDSRVRQDLALPVPGKRRRHWKCRCKRSTPNGASGRCALTAPDSTGVGKEQR